VRPYDQLPTIPAHSCGRAFGPWTLAPALVLGNAANLLLSLFGFYDLGQATAHDEDGSAARA